MGGFLDNPLIGVIVGCLAGAWFLTTAIWDMPNKVDKRTKKPRTWVERWRLANRDTKAAFIIGCIWLVSAVAAAAELVRIIVN